MKSMSNKMMHCCFQQVPAQMRSTSALHSKRFFANSAENEKLVLGLAVSYSSTGFAILRYGNGQPKRFGLIKHPSASSGAPSASASSSSGGAAQGPQHSTNSAAFASSLLQHDNSTSSATTSSSSSSWAASARTTSSSCYEQISESVCAALERLRASGLYDFHCIGLEDSVKDRSLASAKRDFDRQIETSKMQGIVLTELRRLWPDLPLLQVYPQRARDHAMFGFGGRARSSGAPGGRVEENDMKENKNNSTPGGNKYARDTARQKLFAVACERFPSFPTVRTASGKVCESSFYMSDAWATALHARLETAVREKMNDEELVRKMRKQILETRKMKTLETQIRMLHPRKPATDLEEVMESQVKQMLKTKIYHLCNEPVLKCSAAGAAG